MTLTANGQGQITATLTIPAGLPAGPKRVYARGRGGTQAAALYTGSGVISTRTLQRTFSTRIWRDLPSASESPSNDGRGDADRGGNDPAAQSFTLSVGRFLTGVDVKFRAIGNRANPVVCQLREMVNGYPGPQVFAEAMLPMTPVAVDVWTPLTFRAPAWVDAGVERCLVFLTDDAEHKLAVAEGGGFDADRQQFVTAQPYAVGVYFDGSNNATWTAHQKVDLTFRLRAARFSATERVIPCGTFDVVACTDLVVFLGTEIPAAGTNVAVRITRPGGTVYTLRPGQPLQLDQAITETITVALVLTGSALASPVVYPVVQLFAGALAGTGTYISQAKPCSPDGTGQSVAIVADVYAPSSATVVAEVGNPGSWSNAPLTGGRPLGDGWVERTWQLGAVTAANIRGRLTLTGTPRDRPQVRNVKLIVTPTPINVTA